MHRRVYTDGLALSSLTPWRSKRKVNTDDAGQLSRPRHPRGLKRFSTLTPFKRIAEVKYTKAVYTAIIEGST